MLLDMCVISIIEGIKNIPSLDTCKLMEKNNPHYSGIAVFDEKLKMIYVKKGIEAKEINAITVKSKELGNLSIIQHYRIASSGSATNKTLNHPFEISNNSKNELEYYTNFDVLFHNGTLKLIELENLAKQIMINLPNAIYPSNEISDTRLLSWILSYVDYSFLNLFSTDKFAIMNGKTGKITKYGQYDTVLDGNNELITSNTYFKQIFYNDVRHTYDFTSDYITKEENKELKKLCKKYNMKKDYFINNYLDYGYSVFDLEEIIENDLKYSKYTNEDLGNQYFD